jgi:acetylornithine/N-succinyldiaminopimelate aminotransferase
MSEAVANEQAYVMQNYGRAPVVLVRGEGAYLWDEEGRRYLDFLAGISVCNVGHCHPAVVAAIREQAGRLIHTSNLYYTTPQPALARRLVELSFPGRVFFCNSGAEANEAAIKLARKQAARAGHPERYEIITFRGSFHGRTYGALAATAEPHYQEGFGPMPAGFRQVAWNDLDAVAAAVGPQTCAVLIEPVQGESGIHPADAAFLRGLRQLCSERGICLIFDEIQCGLGRVGTLFAHQHYGVRPDVMTLAKALGGGLPIGAVVASGPWAEALRPGDHGTTFGGGPLVCAAALATLETLVREELPARAAAVGEVLQAELRAGLAGVAAVREVRGLGLMIGIELAFPGREVVDLCRAQGLIVNCTAGNVIRLLPPLVIDAEQARTGARIVCEAIRVAAERAAAQIPHGGGI